MAIYYIDWSQKRGNQGWGCSDNKNYHAVFGFPKLEYSLFKKSMKKYKYSRRVAELKLYAFFVAEHLQFIIKNGFSVSNNDIILICKDRCGYHNKILEFTLEFLQKIGVSNFNRSQFRFSSVENTLAHYIALAYTRRDFTDTPSNLMVKEYKNKSFEAFLSQKKRINSKKKR